MALSPHRFFEGVRYVGRVTGERTSYVVYDSDSRYMLLASDAKDTDAFHLSVVPRDLVERVRKRFRGRRVTHAEARRRLKTRGLRGLRALYVLVAQGEAAIKGHEGRSLLFHVYA